MIFLDSIKWILWYRVVHIQFCVAVDRKIEYIKQYLPFCPAWVMLVQISGSSHYIPFTT